MDKHSKKKNILIALIALTLCFIWGNSLMPASLSGAISGWVKNVLSAILGNMGSSVTSDDGVLRKIAHASEFALLGALLTALMADKLRQRLPVVALCGLGAAFIDETIQLFVNGRSGQVKDVWIDLAGFGIGIAITCLILKLIYNGRTRHLRRANCPKP